MYNSDERHCTNSSHREDNSNGIQAGYRRPHNVTVVSSYTFRSEYQFLHAHTWVSDGEADVATILPGVISFLPMSPRTLKKPGESDKKRHTGVDVQAPRCQWVPIGLGNFSEHGSIRVDLGPVKQLSSSKLYAEIRMQES